MIDRFQRLRDSLPPPQDGVLLGIIVLVGISSLLENAVANVTNKIYNVFDGAE